jgi:FkbM family methyltransferase
VSRLSKLVRKALHRLPPPSPEPLPFQEELSRIGRIPRYIPLSTTILGPPLQVVDSLSFCHSFGEIFVKRLYAFCCDREDPYILDCGSNIGLSVIFFKRLFPAAKVVGFEPDPQAFSTLRQNIASFGLTDVALFDRAVWTSATTLEFFREGADAGRINQPLAAGTSCQVSTVRLRDYLTQRVDMLKLDIEGAETDVMLDVSDRLRDVHNIFVEYHSFADRPQRLDELTSVLRANGFRIQVLTEFASQRPLVEHPQNLGMDLQLNIFAFREPRKRDA